MSPMRSAPELGLEAALIPGAVTTAPILDPIVQAVRAALPEFDGSWHDQVSTPHGREWQCPRASGGKRSDPVLEFVA